MTTVTDQKLKAYFLGTLAAAEAEHLEEECAADAKLSEQAGIVESELADDYLRGVLSAAERRLFEENYLTTKARREKLRSAENLWKIVAENQTAAEASVPTFWQTLFAHRGQLVFGSLAALLILGAFVLVWLNINKNPEIAERENISQPANFDVRNQNNVESPNIIVRNLNTGTNSSNYNSQKSANNISPKPNTAPEIKPTPKPFEPPAPTLATFVLLPGTLRSEGEQFIKIPANTGKLRLKLNLPKDAAQYQTYRAVLQTADGTAVLSLSNLKSLKFNLPAAKLENRTYIIFLEGRNADNPAEPVAEYAFRVRR